MERLKSDFPLILQQRCALHLKGNIKNRKSNLPGAQALMTNCLNKVVHAFTAEKLNSFFEEKRSSRGLLLNAKIHRKLLIVHTVECEALLGVPLDQICPALAPFRRGYSTTAPVESFNGAIREQRRLCPLSILDSILRYS